MRYTVFDLTEDWGHEAPGLSLEEAFARLMVLAGCDYSFARDGTEMRLLFQRRQPRPEIGFASDEWMEFMNPDFRSAVVDDEEARRSIMEQTIEHGIGPFRAMPDEEYQALMDKCLQPTHHIPRVGKGWKAAS
jgi:hypothetical protein